LPPSSGAIADRMKAIHLQTELNVSRVRRAEAQRRQSLHDAIIEQRFTPKWPSAVRARSPSLDARDDARGAAQGGSADL